MDPPQVDEQLKAIFLDVFQAELSDSTFDWEKQQNDYENWDSFGHLRIVSEIEEKFGIKLDIDDIIYITSASGFLKIIKDKMH
jgi:acyl carrier protein